MDLPDPSVIGKSPTSGKRDLFSIVKSHPAILGTVVGVVAIGTLILASQTGREDASVDSSRLFTPAPAGEIRTPAPGKSNWVSRLMNGLKLPVGPSIGGKPSAAGTKAAGSGIQSDIAAKLAAARQSAADSAGLDGDASQPENDGRAQAFGGGDSGEGGGGSLGSSFGGFKGAKSGGSVGGASMGGGGGGGGGASGSASARDARASGAAATNPAGKGAGAAAKGPGARPMKAVGVPSGTGAPGGPRAAQQANLGPGTGSALASSAPGGGGGPKYSAGGAGAAPNASAPAGGGGVASSDGGGGPAGGGGGPPPQSSGGGGGDGGPSNQSSGGGSGPDDESSGGPQLDSQTAAFAKTVTDFENSSPLVEGRSYAQCLVKAYSERYSKAGDAGFAMSKSIDDTKAWFNGKPNKAGESTAKVLNDYQEEHVLSHKAVEWIEKQSPGDTNSKQIAEVPDDGLIMTLLRQSEKLKRASVCLGELIDPKSTAECYVSAVTPIASKASFIKNVEDGRGFVKEAADEAKAAAKNSGLGCQCALFCDCTSLDKIDKTAEALNKGLDNAGKAITYVEWSEGNAVIKLSVAFEFIYADAFKALNAIKREKVAPTLQPEWDKANYSARLALNIARKSWTEVAGESIDDDTRMARFFEALRDTQSVADALAWCAAALGARSMGPDNTPPSSAFVAGETIEPKNCLPDACDCGREGDAPPPAACKGGCDDKK